MSRCCELGGGGAANDNLSLVAKDKTGDYAGGNGSKSSVELGWGGGSNGTSSYSLDLAGDFATNADGDVETTLTQDEFDINADSTGNGNDWFRAKHDGKSDVVTDTVDGGLTKHYESKTDNHEEVSLESVSLESSNSSFLLGLSKATGGDAAGSVDLNFSGGGGDQWHVKNKTESEWEDRYDDGYSLQIHKGESVNKYDLDRQRLDALGRGLHVRSSLVVQGQAERKHAFLRLRTLYVFTRVSERRTTNLPSANCGTIRRSRR